MIGEKGEVQESRKETKTREKKRNKKKEENKQTSSAPQPTYPPSFHIVTAFPSHRQCSHLLEEVQEFDYLGL